MDSSQLLHWLQNERGATCAWVAGGGRQGHFRDLFCQWRENANRELQRSHEVPAEELVQLRESVDQLDLDTSDGLALHFYSVFSRFNQICGALVPRCGTGKSKPLEEFARFKEMTGVERAFLCGVLSLPDEEVSALPPRAFADFVLCCHAQRLHEKALRDLAGPSLVSTLSSAFEPPPELSLVRERLQKDFDLVWMREAISVQRWWDLMTSHIDKLQALQPTLTRLVFHRSARSPLLSLSTEPTATMLVERAVEVLAVARARGGREPDAGGRGSHLHGARVELKSLVEMADAAALQEALAALLTPPALPARPAGRPGSGRTAMLQGWLSSLKPSRRSRGSASTGDAAPAPEVETQRATPESLVGPSPATAVLEAEVEVGVVAEAAAGEATAARSAAEEGAAADDFDRTVRATAAAMVPLAAAGQRDEAEPTPSSSQKHRVQSSVDSEENELATAESLERAQPLGLPVGESEMSMSSVSLGATTALEREMEALSATISQHPVVDAAAVVSSAAVATNAAGRQWTPSSMSTCVDSSRTARCELGATGARAEQRTTVSEEWAEEGIIMAMAAALRGDTAMLPSEAGQLSSCLERWDAAALKSKLLGMLTTQSQNDGPVAFMTRERETVNVARDASVERADGAPADSASGSDDWSDETGIGGGEGVRLGSSGGQNDLSRPSARASHESSSGSGGGGGSDGSDAGERISIPEVPALSQMPRACSTTIHTSRARHTRRFSCCVPAGSRAHRARGAQAYAANRCWRGGHYLPCHVARCGGRGQSGGRSVRHATMACGGRRLNRPLASQRCSLPRCRRRTADLLPGPRALRRRRPPARTAAANAAWLLLACSSRGGVRDVSS